MAFPQLEINSVPSTGQQRAKIRGSKNFVARIQGEVCAFRCQGVLLGGRLVSGGQRGRGCWQKGITASVDAAPAWSGPTPEAR